MKITLNWLKRYTDYQGTPDELKEQLTLLGLEVEDMKRTSAGFDGIVVGQVLESKRHPNAEKLSVNRVADGRGERTVVCGASNFKVGDKVPLALPGCVMPQTDPKEEPFMIKVSKLRGVESQGMMCSGSELGLSQDHSGLMILPEDATVGQPFSEYLGRGTGDVTYDMEITPNRPDWNSVIGIAREISALTGKPLNIPPVSDEALEAITDFEQPVENYVGVRLEDPELCPRYVARVIRGVKVGPSPDWLRETLEKVGLRSINNIVDVTNFIMLETGQPLHAFDYHLLKAAEGASKPVIVVRHAAEGEKFTTLDGEEHTLSAEMQVIADETRATALAGVMGGLNTEINDQTVDVLLESACFKPQNIRATSKKTRLAYRCLLPLRTRLGCEHLRVRQPSGGSALCTACRWKNLQRRRGCLACTAEGKENFSALRAHGCAPGRKNRACKAKSFPGEPESAPGARSDSRIGGLAGDREDSDLSRRSETRGRPH